MQSQMLLRMDLAAGAHQLGPSTASYRGDVLLSAKISLACVLLLWSGFLGYFTIVPAVLMLEIIPLRAFPIAFAGFEFLFYFSLLILFIVSWYRLTPTTYIQLYAEGFVSLQRRKITVMRWDEVEIFYACVERTNFIESFRFLFRRELFRISTAQFTLRTQQGVSFQSRGVFLNLARTEPFTSIEERWQTESELFNRIEYDVSLRRWEQALTLYREARPVTFGKVQISAQGVKNGREMRLWSEIGSLVLSDDEGIIREFTPHDVVSDTRAEDDVSSPVSLLDAHLAWWRENVAPGALITLRAQASGTHDWQWTTTQVPYAFVFVVLMAYALCEH